MSLEENLRRQLILDEGRSRYAYKDSRGLLTIGIGRLCDSHKVGSGLEDFEQDWLHGNDCARVVRELDAHMPWVNELDEARKGAVMNMIFQMGVEGVLQFVHSMRLLRAKQYEEAAKNLKDSKWYTQTPNRAARVIEQIRSGIWQYAT